MTSYDAGSTDRIDKFTNRFAPSERTLPVMLQRQAETYQHRDLIRFPDGGGIRFDEACGIAAAAAAVFAGAGVVPGDRVAIFCGNHLDFIRLYLGCAWHGIIAVPINTASRGPQLEHILRNCEAKIIAIDAAFADRLNGIRDAGLSIKTVWVVGQDDAPELDGWTATTLPAFEGHLDAHPSGPGDTVNILYTSGTTGPSKGVCCPQAQYFWWAVHTSTLLEIEEGDVLYTTLPLFHTNALNSFYQALLTGSTLQVGGRFSVSRFTEDLVRCKANVTYLLGAMVPMILSRDPAPEDRNHDVRVILAPGVPARFQEEFCDRFGVGLIDGYGSTETNFVLGSIASENLPGTIGRVRPGFEARVVDADDNPLPDGAAGELVLRASEPYSFATGYYNMPEATVSAWRNLWFHSGDRVLREPGGTFRFLDRMKDTIRRRGENISSFEVEQVITRHKDVVAAAVFPVPSDLAEDEVMVSLVLRDGAILTPEALLDDCQMDIPYFAIPRYVDFVTELPMTENGKIQKFKLRERGKTDTTWDRDAAGYKIDR